MKILRESAQVEKERIVRPREGLGSKVDGNKGVGGKNFKSVVVEGGFARGKLPVSFEPEKIMKMGIPGE